MKMQIRKVVLAALCAAGMVLSAPAAWSAAVTCNAAGTVNTCTGSGTGTQGTMLAASARFEILSGGDLLVTLTNTSTDDVYDPPDVLTALFFTLYNPLTGTAIDFTVDPATSYAKLTKTSDVIYGPQPANDVVGGEWAYRDGLAAGLPGGAYSGISSTGLGIFGAADRFPGPDLDAPEAPNGLNYGITSAGDNVNTFNGGTMEPLIKNAVKFRLASGGALAGKSFGTGELALKDVSFQYGTSLNEPRLPLPSSVSLLAVGLLGLGFMSLKRRIP